MMGKPQSYVLTPALSQKEREPEKGSGRTRYYLDSPSLLTESGDIDEAGKTIRQEERQG